MRRRFGQISKDGTNGPTTNRSPRRKGIVATLVASDNILHGQSPQVYATHPASLEEPHTVETRVVLRVVVGKIGCHFVAEAPPSRGDVLLDNGRLCFVGFSCQHVCYPFKVCVVVCVYYTRYDLVCQALACVLFPSDFDQRPPEPSPRNPGQFAGLVMPPRFRTVRPALRPRNVHQQRTSVVALNHRQHRAVPVAHSNFVTCFELNHRFPFLCFHVPHYSILSTLCNPALHIFWNNSGIVISRCVVRSYVAAAGPV